MRKKKKSSQNCKIDFLKILYYNNNIRNEKEKIFPCSSVGRTLDC